MFAVICLAFGVWRVLRDDCRLLPLDRYVLEVVCCLLMCVVCCCVVVWLLFFAVFRMLHVACCELRVDC